MHNEKFVCIKKLPSKKGINISHCVRSSIRWRHPLLLYGGHSGEKNDTVRGGEFVLECEKKRNKLNPTKMI